VKLAGNCDLHCMNMEMSISLGMLQQLLNFWKECVNLELY
jgi:hypothetical protein